MGDSKDNWCDRISFVDKSVSCASTAKLYYGSAQKPITTAKTTAADYTVKIAPSGRASVRASSHRISVCTNRRVVLGYHPDLH